MKKENINLFISAILSVSVHAIFFNQYKEKKQVENKNQKTISIQVKAEKKTSESINKNENPENRNTNKKTVSEKEPEVDESYYYKQSELTEKPVILASIDIDSIINIIGKYSTPVTINILINEEGGVDDVTTEETHLANVDLNAIKTTLLKSRFLPGKINKKTVKSVLTVQLFSNEN